MQFIKRIIYKLDIRIHLMAPPWLCNVADSFIIYKDDCLFIFVGYSAQIARCKGSL